MKKENKKLVIGLVLAMLVFLPSIIGIFFTPFDPNAMDGSSMNAAPSLSHLFGTDNFGRDILSRIMGGAGATFIIAILTVLIGAIVGTAIGALTGYFGGLVDELLMRLNDALSSLPSILLALVVVSVLDVGTVNVCIALGLVFIPSFARIMRGEVIKERSKDYVKNAILSGAGAIRIIFVHILPNTKEIFLSTFLISMNNAILAEAGLSFLGLGVQPPNPSLGRMLAEAQSCLFSSPWYAIFTGTYIAASVLAMTLVGESIEKNTVNWRKVKSKLYKSAMLGLKARRKDNADSEICAGASSKDELAGNNPSQFLCLRIRGLSLSFVRPNGSLSNCLKDISFELEKREILGIVGESGAGKSMLAKTIMGILPENVVVTAESIGFEGEELCEKLKADSEDLRELRGKSISMVFQEPMTSLNPLMTIGEQIKEVLDIHYDSLSEEEKKSRVLDALEDVRLASKAVYGLYPHELSGGMRQRAIIAMAIVSRPRLIIADEPTTALDAELQDGILDLLKALSEKYNLSVILISHDLRVIGRICDRTLVLKDGQIVENAPTIEILRNPRHEYSRKLILASKGIAKDNKTDTEGNETVLSVKRLNVYYKQKSHGFFSKSSSFKAVTDASLEVRRGDTLGLVGRSGSGKTSLVKAVAGFQKFMDGEIRLSGSSGIGMVFQDPHSSLNPCRRVSWILEEPLKNAGIGKRDRADRVRKALEDVELDGTFAERYIRELSGGQKQRVAIAHAMILKHDLIILDEPVSALDVTIREQILDLLIKLKRQYNLAYIFISHDAELVDRVCNRVALVREGRITEVNEETHNFD